MDRTANQNRPCRFIPDPAAYEQAARLSAVAPAFNEAGALRAVVETWLDYLARFPEVTEFEIVICDDGSRDATGGILDSTRPRAS
jgi:glycosyltransferase involved in cell wall biosynthesis